MKLNPAYELMNFNGVYLLINVINDSYYKIDKTLYNIVENIDRTDIDCDTDGVDFLRSKGIIVEDDDEIIVHNKNKSESIFTITRIKLVSFRVTNFLNRFISFTRIDSVKCWDKLFIGIGALSMILSALCITFSFSAIENQKIAINSSYITRSIPYVYFIYFFISWFHELGHALLCKLHCGFVGKCGVMLFFLTPAFFTNTTISKFASKRERVHIISAGIIFQSLISCILSSILLIGIGWNNFIWTLLFLVFWLNLISMILNINPLFKYDGYWMLSLLCGIDYLYEKSIAEVKNLLFGKHTKERLDIKLIVYGFAVIIFYCLMWIGAIYGIYRLLFPIIGWYCLAFISVVSFMVIKEVLAWKTMKL